MEIKHDSLEDVIKPPFFVKVPISAGERFKWRLYVDAVYKANPDIKNLGAEVLSKLMGVGVQGGFRYVGSSKCPKYIVLFTTGENIYWRDELDVYSGVFVYYGDQRKEGPITDTKLRGNFVLEKTFHRAFSTSLEKRSEIPPIFVFQKAEGRDVKFLGLAVPGVSGKPQKEWLTAVWGVDENGTRFLNYKSFFTILNTVTRTKDNSCDDGINLAWLTDIESGNALQSKYVPEVWKRYIEKGHFEPLVADPVVDTKISEAEQLPPKDSVKFHMLESIHRYFIDIDGGYAFEKFANYIVKQWDHNVDVVDTTASHKDGGFDGIGTYIIFKNTNQSCSFKFFVQAKCYDPNKVTVGVDDTKRLISRIKNRQFGILVTTSKIAPQAYKEIIADGHPVVFITGKNIVDLIEYNLDIRTVEELENWLKNNFPKL